MLHSNRQKMQVVNRFLNPCLLQLSNQILQVQSGHCGHSRRLEYKSKHEVSVIDGDTPLDVLPYTQSCPSYLFPNLSLRCRGRASHGLAPAPNSLPASNRYNMLMRAPSPTEARESPTGIACSRGRLLSGKAKVCARGDRHVQATVKRASFRSYDPSFTLLRLASSFLLSRVSAPSPIPRRGQNSGIYPQRPIIYLRTLH